MSIVAMKKVTVCGLLKEKEPTIAGLQRLGCMHLVPLAPAPAEPEKAAPAHAVDAYRALKYLMDGPRHRRPLRRDPNFDVERVVADILATKDAQRSFTDRHDFLVQRIAAVEPWGDFRLPAQTLGGYMLWFYIVPLREMRALEALELPWQVVHRTNKDAYVVVIAREEPAAEALPVPRTHTGRRSLSELRAELEDVEVAIEAATAEREALTRYTFLLQQNLARAEDSAALRHALEQALDAEEFFALQGWVPAPQAPDLVAAGDAHGLAVLVEDPAPDEQPPTLLDEPPAVAAGSDLAVFYQTPDYRAWDPSLLLFASFAVFFAMILSDAGYAVLLLLLTGYLWGRMGASDMGRRMRNLMLALGGASLVYGIMVGSYFGIAPDEGGVLAALKVLELNDFDTMMTVSIVIGVGHIALANLIEARRLWGRPAAYARLGWAAAVLSGLLIWRGGPGVAGVGIVVLVAALAAVFLFASERVVRRPVDLLRRGLDGLLALTNVTKIFGDVLSYMRLFALGLASASLALTFNQLAGQINDALPGIGLFLSLLVLVVGHALNLGLAVMSGVVHGLRLNFIEFYNWGMSGEGYAFDPLRKREVET